MPKIEWFKHGGGAFDKVVDNMMQFADDYNGPECITTCNSSPGFWPKTDKKKVWFGGHTYNKFLKGRIPALKIPDLIVGFSPFCAQTYRDLGHDAYDGHLGVDTEIYHPRPRESSETFRFYSPCWAEGYGADILLKAWNKAYPQMENVELIVKTHFLKKSKHFNSEKFDHVPGLRLHLPLGWSMSENELSKLYGSADCMIYPTPSLGSSLTVLEAMACGLPVIACRYSGFKPFIDFGTGYVVDYDLEPVPNKSNLSEGAVWAIANHDDLVQAILNAYNNEETLRRKSLNSFTEAKERWTWKHAAENFHRILEANL